MLFYVLGVSRNSCSLSRTLMQSAGWNRDSVLALEWNKVHLSRENRPVLSSSSSMSYAAFSDDLLIDIFHTGVHHPHSLMHTQTHSHKHTNHQYLNAQLPLIKSQSEKRWRKVLSKGVIKKVSDVKKKKNPATILSRMQLEENQGGFGLSFPVVVLSIHTNLCQISELIALLAGEQRAERAKLVCSLR